MELVNLMLSFFLWISVFPTSSLVCCQSQDNAKMLIKDLTSNYNKLVRPVIDQSQPVMVYMKSLAKSIYDFDEVYGTLHMISVIFLLWTDEGLRWNTSDYGGISRLLLPYTDVWVPAAVLSNPTQNSDAIGSTQKDWIQITYDNTGRASLVTTVVTKTSCSANVEKYPFDVQTCEIIYTLSNYLANEAVLATTQMKADLSQYEENALWEIVDSSVIANVNNVVYSLKTTLKLKRRPSYVLLNTILPIFCLSFLKNMVFLLPADAGERVSYSITVLLSISVFMTIVNGSLPASANPVSIFSIYLITELLLNMVTTTIVIMNLRLHHSQTDNNLRSKLQHLLANFVLKISKRGSRKVLPNDSEKTEDLGQKQITVIDIETKDITDSSQRNENTSDMVTDEDNVTNFKWTLISVQIDTVCFPLFCFLSTIFFLLFIFIAQVI